jgi:hypothetical protein
MNEDKQPDPVLDAEVVEETAVEPTTGPTVPDPDPVTPAFDYNDAGVPTFDYVRDRIENKFTTSVGSTELADATPEGKSVDEQFEAREKAGRDKLEAIRRAMRGE